METARTVTLTGELYERAAEEARAEGAHRNPKASAT
jgi:hypothetical protein